MRKLLLVLAGGVTAAAALSQGPASSGPATAAFEVNSGLAELTSAVTGLDANARYLENLAGLKKLLRQALELDGQMAALRKGPLDKSVNVEARRFRALALIHGWASFSRLVDLGQGHPDWVAGRQDLLGLGRPAACLLFPVWPCGSAMLERSSR